MAAMCAKAAGALRFFRTPMVAGSIERIKSRTARKKMLQTALSPM